MARYQISREIAGKSATAFEHLRQMAIEGELPLGRRLAPQDLASYFGVSASPVRDALMRLSAEGLIDWRMSQGFFSKPYEVEEQRQLHETLLALVSAAFERLAPSPPTDLLLALSELDPDKPLTAAALEDHVRALTAATGNRVLSQAAWSLIDRTHLPREIDLRTRPEANPAADLRAIGAALLAGDAVLARQAAARLVAERLRRLPALVDQANAKGLRSKLL